MGKKKQEQEEKILCYCGKDTKAQDFINNCEHCECVIGQCCTNKYAKFSFEICDNCYEKSHKKVEQSEIDFEGLRHLKGHNPLSTIKVNLFTIEPVVNWQNMYKIYFENGNGNECFMYGKEKIIPTPGKDKSCKVYFDKDGVLYLHSIEESNSL